MAIANLEETLLMLAYRKATLENEIMDLQNQKTLGQYAQGDAMQLQLAEKNAVKNKYRAQYDAEVESRKYSEEALREWKKQYADYTQMDGYEEEIDRIVAQYNEKINELTAWEGCLDSQITVKSTELEEVKAQEESYKSMLSKNIQDDFNYGLNQ